MLGWHWLENAYREGSDGALRNLFLHGTGITRVSRSEIAHPLRLLLIPAGPTPTPSEELTHSALSRRNIYSWNLQGAAISPRLTLVTRNLRTSFPMAYRGSCGFEDPRYSNGIVEPCHRAWPDFKRILCPCQRIEAKPLRSLNSERSSTL